ncbi:MAG: ferritin-like domain-containing protein [Thermotogota bacterium]|nr:ferritin-like domain-containing protein [Thermotogota bacterium]
MYHEDLNELSEKAKDITRALNSLKEEVEAIDWYNQRADVAKDESIKAILEHNRDEEIEHAAMIIEWLRRNMEAWDDELKTYLFTEGSITEIEEDGESEGSGNDLGLSKK